MPEKNNLCIFQDMIKYMFKHDMKLNWKLVEKMIKTLLNLIKNTEDQLAIYEMYSWFRTGF